MKFNDEGYLPPGLHQANVEEIAQLLVFNDHRQGLWRDFLVWMKKLAEVNLPYSLIIDGSFVTNKELPKDIDAIIDIGDCTPELFMKWIMWYQEHQKEYQFAYRVDFYISHPKIKNNFEHFFSYVRNKPKHVKKGLIRVHHD